MLRCNYTSEFHLSQSIECSKDLCDFCLFLQYFEDVTLQPHFMHNLEDISLLLNDPNIQHDSYSEAPSQNFVKMYASFIFQGLATAS
jgi:hypothetical protein